MDTHQPFYIVPHTQSYYSIFLNFKSYGDFSRRYRLILKELDRSQNYNFYILSNTNFDSFSKIKAELLIEDKVEQLTLKINLIYVELKNSIKVLQSYTKNTLTRESSIEFKHEEQRLTLLKNLYLQYLIKREKYSTLYTGLVSAIIL